MFTTQLGLQLGVYLTALIDQFRTPRLKIKKDHAKHRKRIELQLAMRWAQKLVTTWEIQVLDTRGIGFKLPWPTKEHFDQNNQWILFRWCKRRAELYRNPWPINMGPRVENDSPFLVLEARRPPRHR